jgi:glutamyl-tRNA reductase
MRFCVHIILVGVDHSTAPIALRERLAFAPRHIPSALHAARQVAQECVLLSTCNRVELVAVCQNEQEGIAHLHGVVSESRQVSLDELLECSYALADEEAIAHLFGVAAGLHSQVLGEPQVQGQVSEALEVAQGGGFAGPITSALFRAALVAGKRVRTETAISRNAVSISHVAVQLARRVLPNLNEASILLVGSGQMSEVAASNLCDNGARRLVIVNRTDRHGLDLAQRFRAVHRPFSELAEALAEADVVISSTTAPRAIITPDLMQQALRSRAGSALLLIDLALPRDVEPAVGELPGVHLYNLDDLQAEVSEGLRLRSQEIAHTETIIAEEVQSFTAWLRSLSVVGTISDLRQRAETLRQQELDRALRRLAPTLSEHEAAIVQELTTRLVNKLLHAPTVRLKDAAASGQSQNYAEALRYLFDLEEQSHERYADWNEEQQAGADTDAGSDRAIAAALAQSGDCH